jgi:hypothetical protein
MDNVELLCAPAGYKFMVPSPQADDPDLANMSVYPNPANDKVTIYCNARQNANLSVYTLLGNKVLGQSLKSGSNEVNIAALAKGVYFVKVTTNEGTFQQQLIKE